MKRVVVPELLDTDAGTPREVEDSLADLRMFNRYFGGVHTMSGLLETVAKRRKLDSLSWLDVAGGSGDLALLTTESMKRRGVTVEPILLDRALSHLDGKYSSVCGDALALPFRDNSFDVVGSCLFAHHLEPPEIKQFIREALRVARHAVLVNDLVRHPVHLALSMLGRSIYRSRITRHDAVASVRRAYTMGEMLRTLREAGINTVEARRFFLFRMGVIVWKQSATT